MKYVRVIVLISCITLLSAFGGCPHGSKNLVVASDAIAHSLLNAQQAAEQATKEGVITQQDDVTFNVYLSKTAQAGQALDAAIKANESATQISDKVNVFLSAFNDLQKSGVIGIKNPQLQLTISTIITGAETSVAIISATVGGK